ncbi:MAG: HAD-IB family phosphatase [Chloroflexi bacterium]|nr:HAD-IB family phosphatase [Chloroflexota bacterium]MCL5275336.1 HAD-IB family phosphatase [Chloroflexota bacterium]
MNIASDLEGTLTTGRTWKGVGSFLQMNGRKRAYQAFLALRLPGSALAGIGIIDKQVYGNQWIVDMARLLAGFDAAQLDRMGEWVIENVMWPQRRQKVLDELEDHRRAGNRVILTSGTYLPVARAFARRIGIQDVIGSDLSMATGSASGRVDGSLNVMTVKAERLRALLGAEPLHSAYGDTASDAPMLEMCEKPVAVCPDRRLRQTALARGWRIFEV